MSIHLSGRPCGASVTVLPAAAVHLSLFATPSSRLLRLRSSSVSRNCLRRSLRQGRRYVYLALQTGRIIRLFTVTFPRQPTWWQSSETGSGEASTPRGKTFARDLVRQPPPRLPRFLLKTPRQTQSYPPNSRASTPVFRPKRRGQRGQCLL